MKKFLLGVGSVLSLVVPTTTIVACSSSSETQATTTLKLTSDSNLLPTLYKFDNHRDIEKEDFEDIIITASNEELKNNIQLLTSANQGDKLTLQITYKDAVINFDVQVTQISPKIVVTINKVTITPVSGSFVLDEASVKISAFKRYAKGFIESMIKVAKENGVDLSIIKDRIHREVGIIKNSAFVGTNLIEATTYIFQNKETIENDDALIYSYYLSAANFASKFTLFQSTTLDMTSKLYYKFGITDVSLVAPADYQVATLDPTMLYVEFKTLRGDIVEITPLVALPTT